MALTTAENIELQELRRLSSTPTPQPAAPAATLPAPPSGLTAEEQAELSELRNIRDQSPQPVIAKTPDLLSRATAQFQAGQEKTERELSELFGGKKAVPEVRTKAPAPSGIIETGAKLAGEYFAPQPILMGVPGAAKAIHPALKKSSQLIGKVSKKVAPQVVKSALRKAGKGAVESLSFAGEMLSGVNKKFLKRAIIKEAAGKSIFKGKWDQKVYNELGKKAQKSINWLEKETGKEVGAAKEIVRKATKFTETSKFLNAIDDLVKQSKFGKVQTLNKSDMKNINEIKSLIKKSKTLEELQGVKEIAQGMSKFGTETVSKATTRGQGIIKQISKDIAKDIAEKAPKLKKANLEFSKIKILKKALQTELKDKSIARNLKNITTKSDYVQNLFNELDELAPKKMKFMDELQDIIAREPFEKIFPGKGGGSGSAEGFANILRIGSVATVAPWALPALSPKTQQQIIKRVPRIPSLLKRAPSGPAGRGLTKVALRLKRKGEQQ